MTAPDTTPPPAPSATIDGTGTVVTGSVVTGTGVVGSTIEVRGPGNVLLGSGIVDAQGNYTVTLTAPQVDGEALAVRQVDTAGNISAPTPIVAPDLTAPDAPTALIAEDGGSISGEGEAGATIIVTDASGVEIGSTIVGEDGTYLVVLDPARIDGEMLDVVQSDLAGNESPAIAVTAPDTTPPPAPSATIDDSGRFVTGTGIPGSTIEVRGPGDTLLGTATVNAQGNYAILLSPPQLDSQPLVVTQADGAGNQSAEIPLIAPDLTAPEPPVAAIEADGTTMSGTGENGAEIIITDPWGVIIGRTFVGNDGNWSALLSTPQIRGETLNVIQVDAAGNESEQVAVPAPNNNGPEAPLPVTAEISADGTTLFGTGEPNATVTVTGPGGVPLGSGPVDGAGNYSITLDPAQINGEQLVVVQTDAENNNSSPVVIFAPDITAPDLPIAQVDATGSVLTGTGERGATVTVRDAGGTLLGTATVDGQGRFAVTLVPPQTDGSSVSVVLTDAANNASVPVSVATPDLLAPDAPVGAVTTDGSAVTGTGEIGATVTVIDADGVELGSAQVDGDGVFTIALTPPLTNGEPLTLVQADVAGNESAPVGIVAPDMTAPDAPTGTVTSDGLAVTGTGEPGATISITDADGNLLGTAVVGANGAYIVTLPAALLNGETLTIGQADTAGNASDDVDVTAPDVTPPAAPTGTIEPDGTAVTGTGEAGATILITNDAGTLLGSAVVASNGSFLATLEPPQTNGEALTLVQRDGADNLSAPVPITAPDITPPDAPTGIVASDGTVVTGTGEAGATIRITDPFGTIIGTAIVGANGSYAALLSTPQVNGQTLGIIQTDGAENSSAQLDITAPDITAPLAPTGTIAPDGATISGTGEAGATISVTNAAGTVLGTVVVATDGSYLVELEPPQTNAEQLTLVQTDGAGNISPTLPVTAPDSTPPAAPTGAVTADGATMTGTGEAGATIRIADPSGTIIGTATVAANGSYTATLTPPQLNGEQLTIVQEDAAGNISPDTTALAPDSTPPAAPTGAVQAGGAIVTGTGEAGATIRITNMAGVVLATAIVAIDGSYSATLSTPQTNGEQLILVQSDAAGNVSPQLPLTAPDTTAPIAPTAAIAANGGSVTGQGEAGATITVRDAGGAILGTATVGANGSYVVALSPAQLNGERLSVVQADAAGNASPDIGVTAPDHTPPAAPTAAVSGTGTLVTGTGEAGATVTVTNAAGVVIGTAVVGVDGIYSVTLTQVQANGETVGVIQTDGAGNASTPVSIVAPDITAPGAPVNLAVDAAGTTLTGIGEAGASVQVRDGQGALIGTAVVGSDGRFSVNLSSPQVGGQDLTVTQTDGAGNQSIAAVVGAPFDIAAFDNSTIALIDLLPVSTAVNHGTANYTVLLSLGALNLDAQVLATSSVGFTVAAGHSLDAAFTYDAAVSIGLLSGYSVGVQRWNGSQWVAVGGGNGASFLQLSLLNGNLVSTETLGPGQYRAFVTFDGALGVGLLGSLNVAGTDADFTDIGGVVPQQVRGNVITDPSPDGHVDIVGDDTVIQSVTVNGVTTAVNADGTVVNGAFGRLVINLDGSYSYTPSPSAAAIGKTDIFQYTLVDRSDGETETANLSIVIGSDDIVAAPVANHDSATASVRYQNVVETVPTTQEFSFNTPILSTRSGNDSFTVAANSQADITITVIRSATIALLPSYTITVRNAANQIVDSYTATAIAGLPLGAGISHTFEDLAPGNYTYTVSSTNTLGLAYGSTVYIGAAVTHLDQFSVSGVTGTQGELLANDVTGTAFPVVRVGTGSGFVEVGETPITIHGAYGSLTVSETGHYSYTPASNIAHSTTNLVDSFTYQLMQPNGAYATATLDVTINVSTGATSSMMAFEEGSQPLDDAAAMDGAARLAADPTDDDGSASAAASPADDSATLSGHELVMAASVPDTADPAGDAPSAPVAGEPADPAVSEEVLDELAYQMFEGQGVLEDVLSAYLDHHALPEQVDLIAGDTSMPAPVDLTPVDLPQDPLSYLSTPDDQEKHNPSNGHQI